MLRLVAGFAVLCLASAAGAQDANRGANQQDQRAAAEQLFQELSRTCGNTPEGLAAWPSGEQFRIELRTFFVQPVDDKLAGELEGNERRLVLGALLPLGITTVATGGANLPSIELAGLGEALPPENGLAGVYTGAAWRGMLTVHQGGKCVYALGFGMRLRPPDTVVTVAVEDPAAAPYLEALEAGLIEPTATLVEAMRGQTGLSRVAQSEADWRLRTIAVGRLKDQSLLIGLARSAKAPWVRVAAVAKLTDQARLDEIAQTDKDAEVRKAALDRLAELARPRHD
jgi:hypothetical protein